VLIPPSIVAVIYGWQANTSVGALFAAGFIPGFATGACLDDFIFTSRRGGTSSLSRPRQPGPRTGQAIRESLPALLMPVIILGGIFGGFFTATESAAVAVIYG